MSDRHVYGGQTKLSLLGCIIYWGLMALPLRLEPTEFFEWLIVSCVFIRFWENVLLRRKLRLWIWLPMRERLWRVKIFNFRSDLFVCVFQIMVEFPIYVFNWFIDRFSVMMMNQLQDVSGHEFRWEHHCDHRRRCCWSCEDVSISRFCLWNSNNNGAMIFEKITDWIMLCRHFERSEMGVGAENGCKCGDSCTCNPCTCKWGTKSLPTP